MPFPRPELAKKRAALEKACGHKVHVISGVSGEGINTVLRAMARQIAHRRALRAEENRAARPAPLPRTRAERQSVNFNAPVVPKARVRMMQDAKGGKPEARATGTAAPKAKSGPRRTQARSPRRKAKTKTKTKTTKPKVRISTGKAKAKPKRLSKTGQRTIKKQRR